MYKPGKNGLLADAAGGGKLYGAEGHTFIFPLINMWVQTRLNLPQLILLL